MATDIWGHYLSVIGSVVYNSQEVKGKVKGKPRPFSETMSTMRVKGCRTSCNA